MLTNTHTRALSRRLIQSGYDVHTELPVSRMYPGVLTVAATSGDKFRLEVRHSFVDVYDTADVWLGGIDDDDKVLEWVKSIHSNR